MHTHFSVKIYVKIRTNVLARNTCEYGVTCDTAKSSENIPRYTSIKAMFMLPFSESCLKLGQRSKNDTFVRET